MFFSYRKKVFNKRLQTHTQHRSFEVNPQIITLKFLRITNLTKEHLNNKSVKQTVFEVFFKIRIQLHFFLPFPLSKHSNISHSTLL